MRTVFSVLAAGFSYCIYWAFLQKPISESGALLFGDPWGIVTLADLYIGFFIFSIFMALTVSKKITLLIWIPSLMILGNLTALVYLTLHYRKLTQIFNQAKGVKNESE